MSQNVIAKQIQVGIAKDEKVSKKNTVYFDPSPLPKFNSNGVQIYTGRTFDSVIDRSAKFNTKSQLARNYNRL